MGGGGWRVEGGMGWATEGGKRERARANHAEDSQERTVRATEISPFSLEQRLGRRGTRNAIGEYQL